MSKVCAYPFCSERKKKNEKRTDIVFYSFPIKDDSRRLEWETSLGFRVPNDPDNPHYVCSKHFLKSDFHGEAPMCSFSGSRNWTPRLKLTAVPQTCTDFQFDDGGDGGVLENASRPGSATTSTGKAEKDPVYTGASKRVVSYFINFKNVSLRLLLDILEQEHRTSSSIYHTKQ